MAARGRHGNRQGIIAAYRKYKQDSRGWGEPEFAEFRGRLWALRQKKQWEDDDMMYVMKLQEEGAGYALQELFGKSHIVANDVLGYREDDAPEPEPMTKQELEGHMKSLIRACIEKKWTSGEFMAFIDYLDSDRTMADLSSGDAAADAADTAESATDEKDHFKEAYQRAGKGYRRHVRELLARAADDGIQS